MVPSGCCSFIRNRIHRTFSRAVLMLLMGYWAITGLATPTLTSSLTSIDWASNTWVTLTVNNVPVGSDVKLGLFLDVQGNGVIDSAQDPIVAAFLVRDGRVNWLGSSVIVDDEDGAANGTVVSRIACFGQEDVFHVVGKYLWMARTTDGELMTTPFTVTQPIGAARITGRVINDQTGDGIPGVPVESECFDGTALPTVWTAPDGTFISELPSGVSTSNVKTVKAIGLGYSPVDADGIRVSGYTLSNDLHSGANALPEPLRLVPKTPGAIFEISGRVYTGTNAIPGIFVTLEWGDDNDAMAVTDTNGVYRLRVPAVQDAYLCADSSSVIGLGLLANGQSLDVSGDMANVDLYCPRASLMVSGRVLAADNEAPVVGAAIWLDGNGFGSYGVSRTDGTYEVGLIADETYLIGIEGMIEQGFPDMRRFGELSSENSSITNMDFRVDRGYPITGRVCDPQTNALSGGYVFALRYPTNNAEHDWNTEVDRHGAYRLLAPTGALAVVAHGFPGFINQTYADHFLWEWDTNGWLADPVLNTPAGIADINFFLPQAAQIQGVVRGNGELLQDMNVVVWMLASDGVGLRWIDGGTTDANGGYSLDVLPGSNYIVEAWAPERQGHLWLRQAYDHTNDVSQATPVASDIGAPATDIDFDLEQGGIISGLVCEEDGTTRIQECTVEVETVDGVYVNDGYTYNDGYFEIIVPPGEYKVLAHGSWTSYGVDMYYGGFFAAERELATVVTAFAGEVTTDINFALDPGCTISGRIVQGDGVTPLANCHVYASDYDSDEWRSGTFTDGEGYYTLERLPPGSYRVRTYPAETGLPYGIKYYNDTYDYQAATPVEVSSTDDADGIDFRLEQLGYFAGRVTDQASGLPVTGMKVFAIEVLDTNNPWYTRNYFESTPTDGDGYYTVGIPPGSNYLLQASDRESWYPTRYWSNQTDRTQATLLTVNTASTVSDVDFAMETGGRIVGHVFQADAVTPIGDCDVYAEDCESGQWVDGLRTDQDGYYVLTVPEGKNYWIRAVASNPGLPYVDTWFDGVTDRELAQEVPATLFTETVGIDFHLQSGGTISGHVYREDGITPITDCHVYASDYGNGVWAAGRNTDSTGYYSLRVPTGTSYRVKAVPSNTGLPYLDLCYSNTLDWAAALPVEVATPDGVSGLDFVLPRASFFEGRVTDKATGMPVTGMRVFAIEVLDAENPWNTRWSFGSAPTDRDGYYTVAVPPGSNYLLQATAGESWYPTRYWSNQADRAQATLLEVGALSTVSCVDFGMVAGGRITGYIYKSDAVTPIGDCDVYAEDYETGLWIDGLRTDQDGYYMLTVPDGKNYRVRALPSNNSLPYVDEWFDGTEVREQAQAVPVALRTETDGITFTLDRDPVYGFSYTVISNMIMITGYTGPDTAIIIPAVVEGLPVNIIGMGAFSDCTGLTRITIPASVTYIQNFSFFGCTGLTSLFFEGHAPTLDMHALYACPATVYYLPGTDGWGPTYGGRPTLLWNPTVHPDDFGFAAGLFGFNIEGTTNIPVVIEASIGLGSGVWTPLTNTTLGISGSIRFSDPDTVDHPARFYRIVWP